MLCRIIEGGKGNREDKNNDTGLLLVEKVCEEATKEERHSEKLDHNTLSTTR